MAYTISKNCPARIIFQALDSGYYDYSEYGCGQAAWEAENSEPWVKGHMEEGGGTLESAEAEFLASLTEATPEEALQAAKDGYGWPMELGFVVEIADA